MFYYIKGKLTHKGTNFIALDVGGIGYKIYTSYTTMEQGEMNRDFQVYTYTHIREDLFDIFGFATLEELGTFEMLISVSGVGPKVALAILSCMPTASFALAVIHGDIKAITAAPGVGKKLAERIVLELKDKVQKELGGSPISVDTTISKEAASMGDEAVNALMVLGYSALEAKGAVSNVAPRCSTVEEIIRQSLKYLMN